jgi:hypothetical protein
MFFQVRSQRQMMREYAQTRAAAQRSGEPAPEAAAQRSGEPAPEAVAQQSSEPAPEGDQAATP